MRIKMCYAMLLTFGMWAVVKAQPFPDNNRLLASASGQVATLLANKAIQKELKMTEEEVNKVRDWTKDFRSKAIQIKKDKGAEIAGTKFEKTRIPLRSPEEMEKRAAADAEIRKASYKELSNILKKAQIERLRQIDLQDMGITALADEEVTSALKLTDKQKTSVKGLSEDMEKADNDIINDLRATGIPSIPNIQEAQKKIRKIWTESSDKAIALLADEQKKKSKEMIGEPFDLEKLHSPIQSPKKN